MILPDVHTYKNKLKRRQYEDAVTIKKKMGKKEITQY